MSGRRYVIVGDGAAGTTAAQTLRHADAAASITIVSDDPHPAYFRAALTNYLLGELRDDQIWAVPPTFYAEHRVQRVLGRVTGVDAAARAVALTSGAPLAYDALLIASGARSRPPSFEGSDRPGVGTLRTLQDVRGVLDRITLLGLKRALVIGGGPLALEWALAMRERGVGVTMLVREARFLVGALDAVASDLLLSRIRHAGVDVRLSDEVQAAVAGHGGGVAHVVTKAGATIPCEIVAAAIGVVCNTELLAGSGVALGARGGVKVDDRMRTSVPGIYAAGDVAEVGGLLSQKWEPARAQGHVAALNMAGGDRAYAPGVEYFATRLYDLDFASVGVIGGEEGLEELVDQPRRTGRIAYRKLVLRAGRLVGALMLGERDERVRQRGRLLKRLIDGGVDVGDVRRDLLDPGFDLAGWLKTRARIDRPEPRPPSAVAAPAELRGTRVLKIGALGAAAAAPPAPPPAPAPAPARDVMLSIGLRIPQAALASVARPGGAAWLEHGARRWELAAPVVSLGRARGGDVVLDDAGVSAVHAQVSRHGAEWFLRDLGSQSGTWVNGAQIVVPHALRDGDRLRLGAIELRFVGGSARGPAAPVVTSPAAAVPAGQAELEVRAGANLGVRFALRGKSATIGRDPSSQVRLDDLSVSRRHAVLNAFGGRWHVSDLHSARGTFRNGTRLPPAEDVALEPGDVLVVGDTTLVYTVRAA